MAKYKTTDGIEVKAELVKGRTREMNGETLTDHDFWEITFPDGTVKEMIDTSPITGKSAFAAEFKEVK